MTAPTTLQILQTARQQLLNGPKTWTQGTAHRSSEGHPLMFVDGGSNDLIESSCSLGHLTLAVPRAAWLDYKTLGTPYAQSHKTLARAIGWQEPNDLVGEASFTAVAKWNDAPERTYEEVLGAFDKAVLLAAADDRGDVEPSSPPSTPVETRELVLA